MKQSVATFFVEKLRNGGYTKTHGGLRNDDSFCALGILCDISNLGVWEKMPRTHFDVYQIFSYKTKTESRLGRLPTEIVEWANITERGEKIISEFNDCLWSFSEIADYVEKHWENL